MCVSSFHFIHIIDICLLFSYIWLSLSNNMVMHVHSIMPFNFCVPVSLCLSISVCICVLYYDWMFKKSEFDWFLWWKMLTCEEYDTQIQVRINVVSSLKKKKKSSDFLLFPFVFFLFQLVIQSGLPQKITVTSLHCLDQSEIYLMKIRGWQIIYLPLKKTFQNSLISFYVLQSIISCI